MFYLLVHWFFLLSRSTLFLSPSTDLFWLLYFSVLKSLFTSSDRTISLLKLSIYFAETFYLFICFKYVHNFSLKYVYDGCFKIFQTILISLSSWCFYMLIFFPFSVQSSCFLVWQVISYWSLDILDITLWDSHIDKSSGQWSILILLISNIWHFLDPSFLKNFLHLISYYPSTLLLFLPLVPLVTIKGSKVRL